MPDSGAIVLGFGSVWRLGVNVTRVDPGSLSIVATIPVGVYGYAAAAGLRRLWVVGYRGVVAVDARLNRAGGPPIRIG
ncbi:MAG TPA: hypothetical protein VGJ77_13075 [Gaiellaceae bacterium]